MVGRFGNSLQSAVGARDVYYGESNRPLILGFEIYPDHQGAGQYVALNAGDRDTIVVEDALQQYWYTGCDVVWLRDEVSNSGYMFVDSSGILRDIYVGSRVFDSNVPETACNDSSGTVWLVTSAETEKRRDSYLSDLQREWYDRVRHNFSPVFKGRDGITSVYKLPCHLPD